MKVSNYPVIYSNIDNSCEYLTWAEKDIFIVGQMNKSYNGDILAIISDCTLEDELEKVKPYLDIIVAKNAEYMNWYSSYDYNKASLNLKYTPIIVDSYHHHDSYDYFKEFVNSKLNIFYHSSFNKKSKVKEYIEKTIKANIINNKVIYTYYNLPFLMIDKSYSTLLNSYTIINEDTFVNFYTRINIESLSENIDRIIEGSEETTECPPYLEDANFEKDEVKYVYINDEFIPYVEGLHSIDEPKFKKMEE